MIYLSLEIVAWVAEISAAWKLLLGGAIASLIGGLAAHLFSRVREKADRQREITSASRILYLELADRVGRCLNDYITPWRSIQSQPPVYMPQDRFSKFRPHDPVFYPALAKEIGSLDPVTAGHLISFYFRLEAISRDNDNWSKSSSVQRQELVLMANRFQASLRAGLQALQSLKTDVEDAADINAQVARRYPHIRNLGRELEDLLSEMAGN